MLRAAAGAAILAILVVACGNSTNDGADPDPDDPTAERNGALPGDDTVSCVSEYGPEPLAQQGFAFDGVVIAIGESVSDRGDSADLDLPGVTFEVTRWYAGGRGATTTVDMPVEPSRDGEIAYGPGSRLLVSGQPRWGGDAWRHPIAWGCGFTRYYDRSTASDWESAFAATR